MYVYLSIYLSIYLSLYLSIYLPIYLSIYLSICLSIYLSIYLHSVSRSICLSGCLSVSLSVCNSAYSSKTKHRINVIFTHMLGIIVVSVQKNFHGFMLISFLCINLFSAIEIGCVCPSAYLHTQAIRHSMAWTLRCPWA